VWGGLLSANGCRKSTVTRYIRAARALTQEHLSTLLGIQQSAVSKLERRADMYVSTLRHFIEAMGGQLEIRAVFPDGAVRITQFQALAVPKAARDATPSEHPPEPEIG
jgi:hypothetical protein